MPLPEKNNRVIITSALPYANGDLHIGHLLEHVQTDIWVRLLRANNITCHYVCASDAHGTPIMLRAKELDTEPEKMVEEFRSSHMKDLESFNALEKFSCKILFSPDLTSSIFSKKSVIRSRTKSGVASTYAPVTGSIKLSITLSLNS